MSLYGSHAHCLCETDKCKAPCTYFDQMAWMGSKFQAPEKKGFPINIKHRRGNKSTY